MFIGQLERPSRGAYHPSHLASRLRINVSTPTRPHTPLWYAYGHPCVWYYSTESVYRTSGLAECQAAVFVVGGILVAQYSRICFNSCIDLKNCIHHTELFIHPVNIFSPLSATKRGASERTQKLKERTNEPTQDSFLFSRLQQRIFRGEINVTIHSAQRTQTPMLRLVFPRPFPAGLPNITFCFCCVCEWKTTKLRLVASSCKNSGTDAPIFMKFRVWGLQ